MKKRSILALTLTACTSSPVSPPPNDGASLPTPTVSASSAPSTLPPKVPAPPSPGSMTLFVDSKQVDCEGEGPMTCLRVRASASDEWMLLYQAIEGFTFEAGHSYELRVERTEVKNPPADASSLRYRLIEIVRDEKTP